MAAADGSSRFPHRDGGHVIVAMPVDQATDAIDGSTILACENCGTPCWVSPTGVAALAEGRYSSMECMDCTMKIAARRSSGLSFMPPSEDQLEELKAHRRARGA